MELKFSSVSYSEYIHPLGEGKILLQTGSQNCLWFSLDKWGFSSRLEKPNYLAYCPFIYCLSDWESTVLLK